MLKDTVITLYHDTVIMKQTLLYILKKSKGKVQGMPQSQTAALPRHQEEEETNKIKQRKSNKRTKNTKISSLFPKRGNRNVKRTEKHKNKITQCKT